MAPRLQPGERLLYAGHPSWRSALPLYLKGLALTCAATLVVAAVGSFGAGGAGPGLVLTVAAIGVSATLVGGLLKRWAIRYAITSRRVQIRRGILSRTVREMRIERLRNVTYRQTALQRVLRIGDVDFEATTSLEGDLVFSGVADPARVVDGVGDGDRGAGMESLAFRA